MTRLAFILLLADIGSAITQSADCEAHPTRWANACRICEWRTGWYEGTEWTCADPRTFSQQCEPQSCDDDALSLCPDGVTLRLHRNPDRPEDSAITLTRGACTETRRARLERTDYQ